MKTTVDLPDELLIEAKKRAAETRTTLRDILARGLRRELAQAEPKRRRPSKIEWVVVDGGLPPGVDVADRESLVEWIADQR